MNIKKMERFIIDEFKKIMIQIIYDYPKLNISAKSRVGAELSNFFEEKFVEYSSKSRLFKDSKQSPKGGNKKPLGCKNHLLF